jgi:predicted O-methyltransferase YrrM
MNDVLLRHYTQRMNGIPRIKGRVLNIGLGDGCAAVFFLDKRAVTEVVSIDYGEDTIDKFRKLHGDHPLHTIIQGDAAEVAILKLSGQFDFVYADIIMDFTEPVFATLRAACEGLIKGKLIAPGGVLLIEYQGDVPVEREFRNHWMPEHFNEIRERASTGLQTHPVNVLLYEPK